MQFDIRDYPGKYVMHCKTKEEAKDFCQHLHDLGLKWSTGTSYACCDNWEDHRTRTAYSFNTGQYANTDYFRGLHYTILEWEDFMKKKFTKNDLKTGDIVQYANGSTAIVIRGLEVLTSKTGYMCLDRYTNDMTLGEDSCYNIVAVIRPDVASDCQFNAFVHGFGDLVYDRERDEVEEMTLAEVCKLLGKTIKIVKEK